MAKNKADRQAAMAANTGGEAAADEVKQDMTQDSTADAKNESAETQTAEGGEQTTTETLVADPAPAAAATEPAKGKSIVPSKYAGKYKDGGSSPTSQFIKEQCVGKEGFEFSAFFQLCRLNGIPEEQVKRYESDIAEKKHGAQGRARMTLRNMLATIARKNGKLKAQDGSEKEVVEAKAPVTGAAAKAQETAAAAPQEGASA